jgi:cobalt-zinc-cadmium resistance protein CzcA
MNAVVAFALKQRVLMVALMLFVFVAGFISFINLNIEAYPDPVPPRVEVLTQNPGDSAVAAGRRVRCGARSEAPETKGYQGHPG